MEEYNFTPEQPTYNNEEVITAPEPQIPHHENKKGIGKKIVLSFCSFVLTVAISLASGFIGAHYMVNGKIAELEEKYATANGESSGDTVADVKQNSESTPLASVIAAQNVSNTHILSAINKEASNGIYAAVANAVKDSVVEITTEMASGSAYFQQFVQSGAGSGVIISDDGYIITNNHVIEGATKITVRLTSGKEFTAELIGTDAQADVAVIKIESEEKLPFAIIGNSDKLMVGEEVLAIGNPLGELGGSVTNGIISALDRELTIDGQTMRLLQTNAAINPGNSGGGLFNMNGELVAIVNAKSSGTGIEGLGFAIPVNYAYSIATELLTNGYVSGRPAIGISYIEINNYMDLLRFGVSSYGIYVYDGGETELKNGDRIVSCGDYEIQSSATLKNAIQQYNVGDTITLTVVRSGRFVDISVTLIESKPAEPTEQLKLQIN